MIINAYYYIAKMKLMVFLTYRFEVLTSLGTNLIIAVTNLFLWKTAYRGIDSVAGVNENQMLTYAMLSIVLGAFFSCNVENTIQDRITRGDIAVDLFRPVNLLLCYLAEDIGIAASSVISKLIPLLLIMVVFIQVPAAAGFAAFILFLISTVQSFLISWLISALIGLLCFWVLQLGELKTIKDGIVLLLSGKIIPLWLFPKEAQRVLELLPFQYIYQTPLSIYIGQLPPEKVVSSMTVQLIWVILFTALLCFGWRGARKRVLIQGG